MGRSSKKIAKKSKSQKRRTETHLAEVSCGSAKQSAEQPLPGWLTRSSVYKKIPVAVRGRLDEAILLRPSDCATLEQIADKFELTGRYGISASVLRSYTRKLEQFVRPAAASQLMAGVLGCLPEEYRQKLLAGGQVLLLSRVIRALSAEGGTELSVADLGKLATVLSAVSGRSISPSIKTRTTSKKRSSQNSDSMQESASSAFDSSTLSHDPTQLAEAVRMLYGLPWPPDERHNK